MKCICFKGKLIRQKLSVQLKIPQQNAVYHLYTPQVFILTLSQITVSVVKKDEIFGLYLSTVIFF